MRNTLLVLFAFVLIGTACKKKDEETPIQITKESIAGSYKIGSLRVKNNSSPEVDITSQVPHCERDNIHTLTAGGTYTIADAGETCTYISTLNSTWSLPAATTIVLDGDTHVLVSFNGSKLVFSATFNDQNGTTRYTTTWVRQ